MKSIVNTGCTRTHGFHSTHLSLSRWFFLTLVNVWLVVAWCTTRTDAFVPIRDIQRVTSSNVPMHRGSFIRRYINFDRERPRTAHNSVNDDRERSQAGPESEEKHVETILFVECGFGSDAHGQNSTKAAVRACRNAIEFNQIPSLDKIVPGGSDNMKLDVLLAVPPKYQYNLDFDPVRRAFPYGQLRIQVQDGGMVTQHGKLIPSMGDTNMDMIVVCVAVTVGY